MSIKCQNVTCSAVFYEPCWQLFVDKKYLKMLTFSWTIS